MENDIMDIDAIQECLGNRYPYLMIDRITEIIPGKTATGFKNLSHNEWFFPCHYGYEQDEETSRNMPEINMPGMLQLEALIEIFSVIIVAKPEYKGFRVNEVKIDAAKFYKKILPGDQLSITANVKSLKRGIAKDHAAGYISGCIVCEADIVVAIPNILNDFKPQ